MGRIFESQVVGYLAYRKSPVGYPFFGGIYHVELDVFLRRLARLLFNQVAKIVGRQMQFSGAVLYRRQSYGLWPVRTEVAVQNLLETRQDILVGNFAARDELSVVKTDAVVQKHFDVVYYQRAAVPVYRVLQLGPDVVQTVDNRTALLLRKMEGFIDSV